MCCMETKLVAIFWLKFCLHLFFFLLRCHALLFLWFLSKRRWPRGGELEKPWCPALANPHWPPERRTSWHVLPTGALHRELGGRHAVGQQQAFVIPVAVQLTRGVRAATCELRALVVPSSRPFAIPATKSGLCVTTAKAQGIAWQDWARPVPRRECHRDGGHRDDRGHRPRDRSHHEDHIPGARGAAWQTSRGHQE